LVDYIDDFCYLKNLSYNDIVNEGCKVFKDVFQDLGRDIKKAILYPLVVVLTPD